MLLYGRTQRKENRRKDAPPVVAKATNWRQTDVKTVFDDAISQFIAAKRGRN